jgi:hypothetical protein
MGLFETIIAGGGGGAIAQMARKVGIPEPLAEQAVAALSPALSRGIQRNAAKPGGLESLAGALQKGNHARYVEQPDVLESDESIADGNAILGHIFGSKDVSRNVAGEAAQKTGIDAGILKQMLPLLGGVAMGALAKNSGGGSQLGAAAPQAGGDPLSAISGLLGGGDDSPDVDDLLNLAKKFF